MANKTIVSILKDYSSFWAKYTNNSDFMYIKIDNETKNNMRQNFGVSYNEEVLFIRDTSFWNTRNQGLVLTDNGIYCIPDNDKPEEKIVLTWDIISKVICKDGVLFFYGYGGEEDYCPIHISYFCKDENYYDITGKKCIEIFNRIANCIQPQADIFDQVCNLMDQNKSDDALELAMTYRNERGNENLYLAINYILSNARDWTKIITFSDEGINHILSLPQEDANNLANLYGHLNYQKYSAYFTLDKISENIKECRKSCLATINCISDTAQRITDGKLIIDDARDDFKQLNEWYANDFLSVPYNERKLLCPVKDYSVPLTQEYVSVLDLKNLEKTGVIFPIGHPVANQLYVGHPYVPTKYIPFDNYELVLIDDKVREFCQIAQSLGATEINIECLNSTSNMGTYASKQQASGKIDYKLSSANGNYNRNRNEQFLNDISQSLTLHQKFSPTKEPVLPDNLVWYHNEPSWQRLYEQRMSGGLDEHEERMETKKNQVVENSELKSIAAEMKNLIVGVNGTWEQTMEEKFEGHENAVLAIHVTFAPLNSLRNGKVENFQKTNVLIGVTSAEQEYIDELKVCMEESTEISTRERRLLNRFREQLGISEKRAVELEESIMKPKLTEEEQEYLKEYKLCLEEGNEISSRERRLLDRLRDKLGISLERANELENIHMSNNPSL